ncbi:MAG: hypothetical protein GY826_30040, partial [Fuerstiella sp.]|nr:hypothetical protein [Fuerstiella sp.]
MDTLAPEINNSLKIDVDDADVPMADESVDDDGSTIPLGPGEFPGIRKPFRSLWWLSHVLLGIGFLLPLMAGLAAIPGLSLLALGVMLAAQAQGAKSGRLRDGFPLLPVSTRIGTIGFMTGLFLVPIIMASSVAGAQQVISQLSGISQNGFSVLTLVLQVIVF